MGEFEETDISYLRGQIEGYLLGAARHAAGDTAFDPVRWKNLYGQRIIYDSIPAYPSDEARRQNEGLIVLADWDDTTESKYLKQGASVPTDREGSLVFADGTVVKRIAGRPVMFTLDERETRLIERWERRLLEVVRDAYGFYRPGN